jgi:hypothetical protein
MGHGLNDERRIAASLIKLLYVGAPRSRYILITGFCLGGKNVRKVNLCSLIFI